MSTWIRTNNWTIMTISIKVKTEWISFLTGNRISWNKPSNRRIIIPCTQINRTRFCIKIFTAVPERIIIRIIDILLDTKRIVFVRLRNCTCGIRQINNIAMGILCIILIIRLDIAALLAEFRQQICTTNINLSAVPVTVILYLSDNLLQSFLQSTSI